jgi:hypothetical protein
MMGFKKGHKINLGRVMPEEERKKHQMLGKDNPQFGKPPWNAGKLCEKLGGENNGCWKGDYASYAAKHIWMKVNFGKANKCENALCDHTSKTFHWSNISGNYKRIRSDWQMLCCKCHAKYDGRTKK